MHIQGQLLIEQEVDKNISLTQNTEKMKQLKNRIWFQNEIEFFCPKISFVALVCILFSFQLKAQFSYINVNGTSREMIVHVPSGLPQNSPLVISLHGLNQDAPFQQSSAKWEEVADTAQFVVVYPNAINKSWDISGQSDLNFLKAIINDMSTRYSINRNRVYVTGFSMGGMMSYHTANNMADQVAAIGPVSGYLFANPVSSSRPMPIIHIHGTADDVVGYSGVAGVLSKWRNWNACPSNSTFVDPYPANKPASAGSYEHWGPCENSEIVLIANEGKGHWHSNDNAGVHSTKEIWKFFLRHSLASPNLPVVSITSPNVSGVEGPTNIEIEASASDPNGTITKVEFFNGTTKLSEDARAPYSYTWTNVALGNYTIRVVATDNDGNKAEATLPFSVNVPQAPYQGNAHEIPGVIQLEEYDIGGNGFAYMDSTPGSETDVTFRNNEDVDLENCTDEGAGYNIGWTTAGEWLEYTVDVTKAGLYDLQFRVACNGDDRTVSVAMDGEDIATNVAIPNTTGWQVWQTVTVNNIELMPGQKVMRLTIGETDFVNLNYVTFVLKEEYVKEPFNGTAHTIPGRIEAEEYDKGGEGLGYHEANSNGNQSTATFRNDEVDMEPTQDVDGDYNVAYTLTGEWLEYTVDVERAGDYDLDIRVAKEGDGGLFHIEMDGVDVTGPISVPNTGGWQVWETVTLNDVNLTAGEHVMRIAFDSDYMNLNYVEFRNQVVTSLTNSELISIEIYPNPVKNYLELSNPSDWRLLDLKGIELETGKNQKIINLSSLPSGIYFMEIQNKNHKVIKVD